MDSSSKFLKQNRSWALDAISASRGLEAISCISANICFLQNSGNDTEISSDVEILNRALTFCSLSELNQRIDKDLAYAKRISEGDNLEPEEVDLMYSRIAGVIEKVIALREVGTDLQINHEKLVWIKKDMVNRDDLDSSEKRMSHANTLYLKLEDLINMAS